MQIIYTYPNALARTLTVVSVAATEDPDSVIVETADDGPVMVCRLDNEGLWQQLVALDLVPA